MTNLTQLQEWQALASHYSQIKPVTLRQLFAKNPHRFKDFSLEIDGIFLDYSKNHITQTTKDLLCQLASKVQLKTKIEQLFSGLWQNETEHCGILHTALRNPSQQAVYLGGRNIMADVKQSLKQMESIATQLRQGLWQGYTGKIITDIVHIGIGGSHLGPYMAYQALKPYVIKRLQFHFISNIDGAHIDGVLGKLNPETTLFIIASKSFNTFETTLNATLAKTWLKHDDAIKKQCIAVTAMREKALEFGIQPNHILDIWDWVGGRYSLFSAVGLSLAIAIGKQHFAAMLAGAYEIDQHFRCAPLSENMPVLLGLLGIWYNNFFKAPTHAIVPYTQQLQAFPPYLQQLDMESNGKQVSASGELLNYQTGPITWGQIGTDSQHAVHQMLHQGKHLVPIDFILTLDASSCYQVHHKYLIASCLSQSQALLEGNNKQTLLRQCLQQGLPEKTAERLAAQQHIPGNKPSNMICLNKLTPRILGSLVALYEHKTFVQGAIWGINSFDQCGVELGKKLTENCLAQLQQSKQTLNSNTNQDLLGFIRKRLETQLK